MKKLTVFLCAMVLVFGVVGTASAWTQFNDGGVHNIDYTINDDVWVDWNTPGVQTTVNFLSGGGVIGGYDLQGHEDSIINIVRGNYINELKLYDRSQSLISNGDTGSLYTYDNSQLTVTEGVRVEGFLFCLDNSQVTFSGGSIYQLFGFGNIMLAMSGGEISNDILLSNSSIMTLYGTDFAVDGSPSGYGELTSILGGSSGDEPNRTLSGTLASGDTINNSFLLGNSSKIVLAPAVPIPSAIWLLGSAFIGLVGFRKKFRKEA